MVNSHWLCSTIYGHKQPNAESIKSLSSKNTKHQTQFTKHSIVFYWKFENILFRLNTPVTIYIKIQCVTTKSTTQNKNPFRITINVPHWIITTLFKQTLETVWMINGHQLYTEIKKKMVFYCAFEKDQHIFPFGKEHFYEQFLDVNVSICFCVYKVQQVVKNKQFVGCVI